MKRNALVLFSLLATVGVSAQEVVSSQGASYSNTSGTIDFTVGEVIIDTGTDGTNYLTQGFHQSSWNLIGLEDNAPDYEVSIFPNPADDVLNIKASTFGNVTYTLYDAQGNLVLEDKLCAEQTSVQVSQLAPGSYSLTLSDDSQILKTFKLVKTL